jgi:hypothetical protein
MVEESLISLTVIVGVASAVVSLFTVYYRKKQYEVTDKQLNLTALLQVFQLLNNESHRAARQALYKYYKNRIDGKAANEEEISQQIAMVRSDFEMIGTFVRNRLLSKEVFLDAYWDTTIMCWNALVDNIMSERKLRQNQKYMTNFEYLASEARQYKEKYLPRELIEPY